MIVRPAKHRPLAGFALAAVSGCLLGLRESSVSSAWWFLACGTVFLAAAACSGRRTGSVGGIRLANAGGRTLRSVLRAASLLAAALFVFAAHASREGARERLRRTALEALHASRIPICATGTIVTEPSGFAMPQGGGRLSFRMRVRAVGPAGGESEASLLPVFPKVPFDIDVDFYGPVSLLGDAAPRPAPEAGEGWQFTGRIQSRTLPGRREPLLSLRGSVREPHGRDASADAPSWRRTLWDIRRSAARRLSWGLSRHPREASILRAVLLGYRAEIPAEVREVFAESGTIHLFAISGLHIMLVASLLHAGLQWAGLSRRTSGLVAIPVLVAYAILTGGRPSAQRACLMAAFFVGAPAAGRMADGISALAAAALALLAAQPLQLLDLGFVFSFASVSGILLLAPSLETLFRSLFGFRADDHDGGGRWSLRRWLPAALSVSVSAWAVSVPITAGVFGQFVPVSVVSNLVVIPMGAATVRVAVAAWGVGLAAPPLAGVANRAAAWLVLAMVRVSGAFAAIPGGNVRVEPWGPVRIALWYAVLCAVAFALHVRATMVSGADEGP